LDDLVGAAMHREIKDNRTVQVVEMYII
jgi:hypothetical protein